MGGRLEEAPPKELESEAATEAAEERERNAALSSPTPEDLPALPPHVRDCGKCRMEGGTWIPCRAHQPRPASESAPTPEEQG